MSQDNPIIELDIVALTEPQPQQGLLLGQTGTVMFVHEGGRAFEVEFILEPRRAVVATLRPEQLLKLQGLRVAQAG